MGSRGNRTRRATNCAMASFIYKNIFLVRDLNPNRVGENQICRPTRLTRKFIYIYILEVLCAIHYANGAFIYIFVISSYYSGNARFHLNSEVKHYWACLVLLWGTRREPYVIYDIFYIYIYIFFYIKWHNWIHCYSSKKHIM